MYDFKDLNNRYDLLKEQVNKIFGDRIAYQRKLYDTLLKLAQCYLHIRLAFGIRRDKNEVMYLFTQSFKTPKSVRPRSTAIFRRDSFPFRYLLIDASLYSLVYTFSVSLLMKTSGP